MAEFLSERRLAYVATVRPDGTPSLSPKGSVRALGARSLVFADIRSAGTVANIAANPAVEINSVDPVSRRGYRFRGEARLLEEGEPERAEALGMYAELAAQGRVRGVVLVRVESASEVASPAYDSGATEQEIRKIWSGRV